MTYISYVWTCSESEEELDPLWNLISAPSNLDAMSMLSTTFNVCSVLHILAYLTSGPELKFLLF